MENIGKKKLADLLGKRQLDDLFLVIGMDPDAEGVYIAGTTEILADNDDGLNQFKGVKVSIDLLFGQFNAGHDVDMGNWLVQQTW